MEIQMIHDLPSDVPGKTWKEKNLSMGHIIPINTLVEVKDTGARMFVVKHARDCDGTPLYVLTGDLGQYKDMKDNPYWDKLHRGYAEESLDPVTEKEE